MGELDESSCAAMQEALADWLDGWLPPDDAAALQAHVASCAACGPAAERARAVNAALGVFEQATAIDAGAEFDARFEARLAAESASRAAPERAADVAPGLIERWLRALGELVPRPVALGATGFAVAATVALVIGLVRPGGPLGPPAVEPIADVLPAELGADALSAADLDAAEHLDVLLDLDDLEALDALALELGDGHDAELLDDLDVLEEVAFPGAEGKGG